MRFGGVDFPAGTRRFPIQLIEVVVRLHCINRLEQGREREREKGGGGEIEKRTPDVSRRFPRCSSCSTSADKVIPTLAFNAKCGNLFLFPRQQKRGRGGRGEVEVHCLQGVRTVPVQAARAASVTGSVN